MNPSPFSARRYCPARASRCAGPHSGSASNSSGATRCFWLGMSRSQWFLLMIFPPLFWRILRVFGKPLRPKLEGIVA
jgi:hypothetical protein